jgi:hypothetical protein
MISPEAIVHTTDVVRLTPVLDWPQEIIGKKVLGTGMTAGRAKLQAGKETLSETT